MAVNKSFFKNENGRETFLFPSYIRKIRKKMIYNHLIEQFEQRREKGRGHVTKCISRKKKQSKCITIAHGHIYINGTFFFSPC